MRVEGLDYDFVTDQILDLGTVTGLQLPSNHLSGTIPNTLGNLVNLKWLRLANNQLSGEIPESLGRIQFSGHYSDVTLDLSHNELTGSVPGNSVECPTMRVWLST